MKKIFLFFFIFLSIYSKSFASNSISPLVSPTPSPLNQAHYAFEKKDYQGALSYYQNALQNHTVQTIPTYVPSPSPTVQTFTQKVTSFFTSASSQPTPNPNAKNLLNGYVCLQMGKCHYALKHMDRAEAAYAMGVTEGGDTQTGNACLLEEGSCQLYRKDYQGAYGNLKLYVSRNVNQDPSKMDKVNMKRAVYMAATCAWKLSKTSENFDSDMSGAMSLAKQAFALMPNLDNRLYFKK